VGNQLVATGVSKVISTVTLLRTIDVRANPGECVVLRGPNGSGKTTLLRLLAGLAEPSTGTVRLDERPVDERDPAIRAAIASLLGAPATYRDLTVHDHLTLIDATWGRNADDCEQRVGACLEEFGIQHLADRFPHELSSGQTQLFRLSCVFFRPATTLLLDEPEQRLDDRMRPHIAELIDVRRAAGATIVMACHDPAVTEATATRVLDIQPAEPQ